MANHAALIRSENAGLSVTRRGRNFIEFDLGGGQKRTVFTLDPIHLQGTEIELSTSFIPDTGAWQWKIEAADYQFHARSILNAGNLIEWRVGSEWVIFDPQSINFINQDLSRQQISIKQAVTGQASDCTLSFPAGYGAGRHFEYTALPTKLVKHFILDSLATLPAPTVTGTIWFEAEFTLSTSTGVDLYLDGVKWAKTNGVRVRTANSIEFRDAATGTQVLWRAAAPYAEDAAGNRVAAEYEVRRSGGPSNLFITVRIPRSWLLTATYPVRIDPTLTLGDAPGEFDKDTHILSSNPTTNYGTDTEPFIYRNSSDTTFSHMLCQADLSALAGQTISSETPPVLTITKEYGQSNGNYTLQVQQLLVSWTEAGATYNTRDGSTAWNTAGASGIDTDISSTVDGTYAVPADIANGTACPITITASRLQAMVDGTNNGWRISVQTSGANRGDYYASSDHGTAGYRPQLVVVYTTGGSASSSVSASPSASQSPSSSVSASPSASLSPSSSVSASPSASLSPSSSPSASVSSSPSASQSPSSSISASPSSSQSPSSSISSSPSASPSASQSPSSSVSSSVSASPSSSQSPSSSVSSSISASPSSSQSPSSSESASVSASPSSSQSPSSSISASISASPSSSQSPSSSLSASPSSSVSASPSGSESASPSSSLSPSSSISASPSSSESASQSPSSSVSASVSQSPSSSPSPSSSVSSSISNSPSSSQSPSSSASSSVSASPSSSVSSSASISPSLGYEAYTKGNYATLPANDNDLENSYTGQEYTDVNTKNDVRVEQVGTQEYIIHQFKDFVGANSSCQLEAEVQVSLAPSSSTVYLQIYNQNTTTWDTVDLDNTSLVDTDFTLLANIADLTNYKDIQNVISCRVYQQAL